jgi:hypothetical protein
MCVHACVCMYCACAYTCLCGQARWAQGLWADRTHSDSSGSQLGGPLSVSGTLASSPPGDWQTRVPTPCNTVNLEDAGLPSSWGVVSGRPAFPLWTDLAHGPSGTEALIGHLCSRWQRRRCPRVFSPHCLTSVAVSLTLGPHPRHHQHRCRGILITDCSPLHLWTP